MRRPLGGGGDTDIAIYTGRTDDLKVTLKQSSKRNDGGPKDGKRNHLSNCI